jgi:hypothetical protein
MELALHRPSRATAKCVWCPWIPDWARGVGVTKPEILLHGQQGHLNFLVDNSIYVGQTLSQAERGSIMSRFHLPLYLTAACFLVFPAKAQESATQTESIQSIPVDPGTYANQEMMILRTNCYTNVRDCAGLAYFDNYGSSTYKSCKIYFNNGAGGESGFVLEPGGDHSIHVRYNDTFACVRGNTGVPNGTPRSYIYVR